MLSLKPTQKRAFPARFRSCASAIAMTEFALVLPLFTMIGLSGLEVANFTLANLKISQMALNLADLASRLGQSNSLGVKTIREVDINNAFQAMRLQAGTLPVTTKGRVILSSIERVSGAQKITWQRCLGQGTYSSSYGTAGNTPIGVGVTAADDTTAIMFVEIQYQYQPLISNRLMGAKVIKTKASFIVRDKRDLTTTNNPGNPSPSVVGSTCNLFNA